MKIIELRAENVKRLKAVEITPDGTLQIVGGRNAQGKAQPLSEPVLTPDGWTPIGDLNVGDMVIASNGMPTPVVYVVPQEGTEVWAVTFADGSTVRCSPDHLWTVGSWVGADWTEQVLTTAQIAEQGLFHREHARKWAVPLVAPIDRPTVPLAIEPYALGVLLGDAHIADTGYVQLSTDTAIIDALGIDGYRRHGRGCEVLGSSEWAFRLQALGLADKRSAEKFVPIEYLTASVEQRRALLAGLLDTDGTVPGAAGTSEFDSTSEALADAVVDLVRGLGGFASKGKPLFKHYTYNGEKKHSKHASWHVRIRTEWNPFRLARKAERWSEPDSRRPVRRFIDSIERVEDEETRCIRIDTPDNLYVTKDYVLTHNSSVLDAIWLALGGGRAGKETTLPIHDGESKASVTLDLGDLVVTRSWTQKGTSLKVTSKDGAVYSSPQKMLDELVGRLSFDPLEFTRLSAREQRDALLDLVDLDVDVDALDRERAEVFAQRTEVGRQGKAIGDVQVDESLPVEEQSAGAIIQQIRAAEDHNREVESYREQHSTAERRCDEIAAQIRELQDRLQRMEEDRDAAHKYLLTNSLHDTAPLEAKLATVEETNAQIRANNEARKKAEHKADMRQDYEILTRKIAALDEQKAQALASASFPVTGLGFDEQGVTFQGVPFSQASSAEQIRVSLAMAMALNPKLRVLRIKDGSLLDEDTLAAIREQVKEQDFQLWLEVVTTSAEGGAVLIEDGEVL